MNHKETCPMYTFSKEMIAVGRVGACTCSEQSTPGHGGKMCTGLPWPVGERELVYDKDCDEWLYKVPGLITSGVSVTHCPFCPTHLIPDPEPLPVPEGLFAPVESAQFGRGLWRVRAVRSSGTGWREVVDFDRYAAESAWRRAFGKEKRDE